VQIIVKEAIRNANPRNKGAEIGNEVIDLANIIAARLTGVSESL
jgi:hypothetical protein